MKAAVCRRYGPPEVVQIEEIAAPVIGEGMDDRVVVRVRDASLNPFDLHYRRGYLPVRFENGWTSPKQHVLGIDVAGTVEAIGGAVTRFKPGEAVFGHCLGSHAQFVRARESTLSRLPSNLDFEQAAVVPCAALTALQALRDIAKLQPGQSVLISGASGGVGHFAVQLARHFGAEVTAVTSTPNLAWVKALGAEEMYDYTRQDFTKNGKQYDVIMVAAGKRSYFSCKRSLAEKGVFISESPKPEYQILQVAVSSLLGDPRPRMHLAQPNQKDIELIRELLETGRIRPVIEKVYPLSEIAAAHRHLETGRTRGKLAVEVQR
jgi:NADPH:quinone reductase-like Zn-dependent oxidoreductase